MVNFRGTSGVPLTSGKFYCSASWEDMKEPIDYIYKKYCSGQEEYAKRNLYAYGVSMGANALCLYLVMEGAKSPLSGAVLYSSPFSLEKDIPFFKSSLFGFYNFAMGFNFA